MEQPGAAATEQESRAHTQRRKPSHTDHYMLYSETAHETLACTLPRAPPQGKEGNGHQCQALGVTTIPVAPLRVAATERGSRGHTQLKKPKIPATTHTVPRDAKRDASAYAPQGPTQRRQGQRASVPGPGSHNYTSGAVRSGRYGAAVTSTYAAEEAKPHTDHYTCCTARRHTRH